MLDTMTLDQLRALEAVAETGSFSAAARRLGRVQSAVSQAIQALEVSLGVVLFDRSGKVPRLNDAGRVVLDDARNLLRGAEALKARAESIAEELEPELTLAVESMFPMNVLTEALKALQVRFPLLPVTVYTEALGGAEQRLRDGAARIAFYPPNPIMTENRETEFVVTIPTVPVVAATHPLAREPAPLAARRAGAAGATGAHRSLTGERRLQCRHRQPPDLAFRRPQHAAGISAGGLRLVQHATADRLRAHPGGAAEGARHRPAQCAGVPHPRGLSARAHAGQGRALADRYAAPALQRLHRVDGRSQGGRQRAGTGRGRRRPGVTCLTCSSPETP